MSGPPGPSAARAASRGAGRRRVPWLGGASALIALSCSLMIDPDALSGGSDRRGAGGVSGAEDAAGAAGTAAGVACGADEKVCELDGALGCFPTQDPDLGCGTEGCAPCDLPHAVAVCGFRGLCRIAECSDAVHSDCDAVHENGCEVDLRTSAAHCGACDEPCARTCVDGVCVGDDVAGTGAGP